MADSNLDGGEALLQACRDLGADYIFSSAGSEWAPVWEALARQAARGERKGAGRSAGGGEATPRYLDLTHETVAVGMATGYATVTGRVQVVLLHAGAGLLQGANAVHGALLTGAPIVVCSGESTGYGDAAGHDPGSQWYRNLSMVGGPQALAAPFTKWACAANDVGVLYGMVKRAGELAAQSPAGPTYVNTPVEVLLDRWHPARRVSWPRTRMSRRQPACSPRRSARSWLWSPQGATPPPSPRSWNSPNCWHSRSSSRSRHCARTSRAATRCTRAVIWPRWLPTPTLWCWSAAAPRGTLSPASEDVHVAAGSGH